MVRGYLYTLEVLIALSLLFVTLVYIFRFPLSQPVEETGLIARQGFNALYYLDRAENLRYWVYAGDEASIESKLRDILPVNIGFETEICQTSCSTTNVPPDTSLIVVDYYIGNYNNNFVNKKIRLFMWGRE